MVDYAVTDSLIAREVKIECNLGEILTLEEGNE
jgi:hypothetical protein